jgi:DNA-binding LytR/AlgR family response regulator
MKVLVFENERVEVEPLFKVLEYYHKGLEFDLFSSSQAFKDWSKLKEYSFFLVDLKLSDKTRLEGIEIIGNLISSGIELNRIAIITGHTEYRSKINKDWINDVGIFEKPLSIKEIEAFLKLVK